MLNLFGSEKREVYSAAIGESSCSSSNSAISSDVHVREDSCVIDSGVSSSSTTTILATQSIRAAVPQIRSADSRSFAVPSIVYNLNNCTVHNIGTST